ncbi:MAG: NCS2 family nucleobase:cation symporter [Coriobacteriia bacterium]|nr:NCS2 family nucleobase:cation symporter [Coriobacteriia bacterium]
MDKAKVELDTIHQLDGRPPLRVAVPLGLQHVLTMFVGNLAPVIIISSALVAKGTMTTAQQLLMIQCAMLISGLATLLQLYPLKLGRIQIGARLPIVMGTSFIFLGALLTVGLEYGPNVMFGAIIVGSVVQASIGLLYQPLSRFFPPVVIGCVLMTIGLSLLPVGTNYLAGGAAAIAAGTYGSWQNILVGLTVMVVVLIFQRWGKGFSKTVAILIAVIVGYVLAACFGMVDFSIITNSAPVALPIPSVLPAFQLGPILTIGALYIVCALETIGNTNGITAAALDRPATPREVSGAILSDAVSCAFAGLFNGLPNTAFGQNAGIVAMTKVINRWCIATGAFILILAGFFPPIGAIFSAMPSAVLGGAVLTVFGMIIINGIKLIVADGLSEVNILIICVAFGLGYGITLQPALIEAAPLWLGNILNETTLVVFVVAFLANLAFRQQKSKKSTKGAASPESVTVHSGRAPH